MVSADVLSVRGRDEGPVRPTLADMALQTSAEHPVPVRTIANAIAQWVGRLGAVWVEGQVADLRRRPQQATCFLVLRDPVAAVSLSVTVSASVLQACTPPLADGARVVVHARPQFYLGRGTLSLVASEIRSVGLGALLERLERVRQMLAQEGLFDDQRKRPLPFLPTTVGLVCGRASAAMRDVIDNATRRWPAVQFRVEEVAVQGPSAVASVIDAVTRLDRDSDVDVIVVARGGGSVEDLLPFSDEQLLRAVAAAATPVVSAIGHEPDAPLLDLVADVRASTPTDAARRVVPDVAEQAQQVDGTRQRLRQALHRRVRREQEVLDQVCSRSVLAEPTRLLAEPERVLADARARGRRCLRASVEQHEHGLQHTLARLRSLSPSSTLARGYAVVQRGDGAVVRDPAVLAAAEHLHVRVAEGTFDVNVIGVSTNGAEPVVGF